MAVVVARRQYKCDGGQGCWLWYWRKENNRNVVVVVVGVLVVVVVVEVRWKNFGKSEMIDLLRKQHFF